MHTKRKNAGMRGAVQGVCLSGARKLGLGQPQEGRVAMSAVGDQSVVEAAAWSQ